jgi:DNA-directed RNA polymerase specialized sigma24 family protein
MTGNDLMASSASQVQEQLLARARQGSQLALEDLMASCRSWLCARARGRMPCERLQMPDASDLVRQCQCVAAVRFDEFRGADLAGFHAWLAGILDRRLMRSMQFRGDRGRRRSPAPARGEGARREPAAPTTAGFGRLSQDEQCERLRLAASWCRADDLVVISMRLFEGRGHDEIADELEIAVAAARQRYHGAVRRMSEALRLLERMSRLGWGALRQDVVGLHRFHGAGPVEIAARLQVPEDLATRWIAEAGPLLRSMANEEDSS